MACLSIMKLHWLLLLGVASCSLTVNASRCGKSRVKSGKVIGGENATAGEWPWQIALLYEDQFICGGSLIRPNWVVTASHCVEDDTTATNYNVVVGDHNRDEVDNKYRRKIAVKKVIMHPEYNSPMQLNNDIALIQLKKPAQLNERVNTVCLPKKEKKAPVGGKCFLTGWGKIRHPGGSHPILQKAFLPVLSEKHCKEKLKNSEYGDDLQISKQMVCAEDKGTMKSGCHGDSGGPFVCAEKNGIFTLHGVVSWGSPECNITDAATVFARVTEFVHWIEKTINNTEGRKDKKPKPPVPTTVQPKKSSAPNPSPTPVEEKVQPKTDKSGKVLCEDDWIDCGEMKQYFSCNEIVNVCTNTCHSDCVKEKPQPPTKKPKTPQKPKPSPGHKPSTPPHPTPTKPGNGSNVKPGKCGRSTVQQGRIVHGVKAKDAAWPWIASLESDGDHFCGGTLITPQWVMTAAHCVEDIAQDIDSYKKSFKIILGDYDKKNTPAEKKQIRGFTKVIVHETWPTRYENNTWNDIALVKLSSPVILNNRVNIACLPEPGKKPKIGRNCYLAGWGTIVHPSPNTPDVLQQAVLPIVSTDNCLNERRVICTGFGKVKAANACKGDSGGPLQCQNDDASWTVHGIASFVKEYCKYYTAFADAGLYRDWIRKYVPET